MVIAIVCFKEMMEHKNLLSENPLISFPGNLQRAMSRLRKENNISDTLTFQTNC